VPIEELQVGDEVLAWNESTQSVGSYPISAVWAHDDPTTGWVVIDGEAIATTPGHPFYTVERGWVEAAELRPGDYVPSLANGAGTVGSVTWLRGPDRMYDLTVDIAHTFYVGDGGWLVHNCSAPRARSTKELREVIKSWDKGTYTSRAKNIKYHHNKWGGGRTVSQYTRDANRFADQNRARFRYQSRSDKPNWQPSWYLKIGRQAGHYTTSGKILTYRD